MFCFLCRYMYLHQREYIIVLKHNNFTYIKYIIISRELCSITKLISRKQIEVMIAKII